ncbi:MAG: type I DNA topoisomerase [Bacteroidetes bacterium]|nr:type I DNA topoisomerase [Bacteroidota bacterium]
MIKNLVIVESPAKAKTIEKFLGSDFTVKSSYGHIRDLPKDDSAIDIKNGYKPFYIVPIDKRAVVADLKRLSKQAENVWLASDEDREGEAISWHLAEELNLDITTTKRIVFHEITKEAIQEAIANPRIINKNLVDAQQARRVLDRLVGFELSPVLWKKVKGNLSAGRVQSVAVRLIVEREREINDFNSVSTYKVAALFDIDDQGKKKILKAELVKNIDTEANAENFLRRCLNANYTIENIENKPAKKSPSAPFTTSTLQQEASRKLGYGVTQTMVIAQKLYEAGHITYMRTDSVNLSDMALQASKKEIEKSYGKEFYQYRKFTTKSASAQEAHEAIRPTYFEHSSISGDNSERRLYELIWKRTVASQMADAQLEKTIVTVGISTTAEKLIATGEVLKFEGFLKVYLESNDEENADDDEAGMLPPLKVGENLVLNEMDATQRFSRAAARYTEASLVKKLEELGIGRPSTYAPTISTVQRRGYVVKEDRPGRVRNYQLLTLKNNSIKTETKNENTGAEKSKLFPSDIGNVVTDFLLKHFEHIMDYNFTALVEKEFDEIAEGQMEWEKMIDEFYLPFHKTVEDTSENAERVTGERILGKDPVSGKTVSVRVGRYGPLAQIGDEQDEKKQFATLRAAQSIETITFEEALDLFKLPLFLGAYESQEVSVNIGRFGPYIKLGEQFISLPKGEEPLDMTLERAIELIQSKQLEDAPISVFQDKPVTKGKGRFGPFIKWNEMYINIPRAYNFDHLSEKDCEELILKKIEKEANRFIHHWPEEKISVENGRWGAFIKFNKKMLKITGKTGGGKYTPEELALLTLDEIKKMIEAQVPNAFAKKVKKAASKKATSKKAAPKKAAAKKAAKKKA